MSLMVWVKISGAAAAGACSRRGRGVPLVGTDGAPVPCNAIHLERNLQRYGGGLQRVRDTDVALCFQWGPERRLVYSGQKARGKREAYLPPIAATTGGGGRS